MELADYYFLHRIQPNANLLAILKSQTILDNLGLNKFLVDEKITASSFYLFSFMVNSNTEKGTIYRKLSALVAANNIAELEKFIQQGVAAKAGSMFIFRMMLALIPYYEYYNICQSCPTVLKVLQQPNMSQLLEIQVCNK